MIWRTIMYDFPMEKTYKMTKGFPSYVVHLVSSQIKVFFRKDCLQLFRSYLRYVLLHSYIKNRKNFEVLSHWEVGCGQVYSLGLFWWCMSGSRLNLWNWWGSIYSGLALLSFLCHAGQGTSNYAEVLSLKNLLRLAMNKNISHLQVYDDSFLVAK